MGTKKSVSINEIRVYQDPKNPTKSDYDVVLPVTATDAVIDTKTGKTLTTLLSEGGNSTSDIKDQVGSKTDTAGTTTTSTLFSWVKAIYTHMTSYLSSTRMNTIETNTTNAKTAIDTANTNLGTKADAAGTAATNTLFSWIKSINTHLTTYLSSTRMSNIETNATNAKTAIDTANTNLGTKADAAGTAATNSLFSWVKSINTHITTYLSSTRMAKIDQIDGIKSNVELISNSQKRKPYRIHSTKTFQEDNAEVLMYSYTTSSGCVLETIGISRAVGTGSATFNARLVIDGVSYDCGSSNLGSTIPSQVVWGHNGIMARYASTPDTCDSHLMISFSSSLEIYVKTTGLANVGTSVTLNLTISR